MSDAKRMTWGDRAVEAAKIAQGFFAEGRVAEGIAAISLSAQMLQIQRNLDNAAAYLERDTQGNAMSERESAPRVK